MEHYPFNMHKEHYPFNTHMQHYTFNMHKEHYPFNIRNLNASVHIFLISHLLFSYCTLILVFPFLSHSRFITNGRSLDKSKLHKHVGYSFMKFAILEHHFY